MAGRQSAFVTGANARVKVDQKALAYATDVSYNIAVQTIPIETMGTYEVRDNVAVAYTVDGSFSVIKYTSAAQALEADTIPNGAAGGNKPSKVNLQEGTMANHLNPKAILSSGTFDLEIYEQLPSASGIGDGETKNVFSVKDCRITRRGMTLNKRGVYVDQYAFVGILAADNDGSTFDADLSAFPDLE